MKIQILSDLHLEFVSTDIRDHVIRFIPGDKDDRDVLVIAGDLGVLRHPDSINDALEVFCNQYNLVIYVPGNHEFYSSSFSSGRTVLNEFNKIFPTLQVLDIDTFMYNNTKFVGSTMWFRPRPENFICKGHMNDFKLIGNEMEEFHIESEASIILFDEEVVQGCIVVTHHLPSERSVSSMYKGSITNQFYVNDRAEKIISYVAEPKLWIHGHSHSSSDYMLGNTRVICNPYGYEGEEINKEFNDRLIIEI